MDPRSFLATADQLALGATEADWRSAVSSAYYAAFQDARQLFTACGFTVPRADRAHSYLWLRLCNSGDVTVQRAGADLDVLRRLRNHADYDVNQPLRQATALSRGQKTRQILQALDAASQPPLKTRIADAMKVYERDVLNDVTWRPGPLLPPGTIPLKAAASLVLHGPPRRPHGFLQCVKLVRDGGFSRAIGSRSRYIHALPDGHFCFPTLLPLEEGTKTN